MTEMDDHTQYAQEEPMEFTELSTADLRTRIKDRIRALEQERLDRELEIASIDAAADPPEGSDEQRAALAQALANTKTSIQAHLARLEELTKKK